MKVDKIIFVSDSNINYLSFWNSVARYHSQVLGFKCKLFFIRVRDSETDQYLSEEYGEVEVVAPIPDIPIIIQALWAKFWFTQTEPDTNWLIGDIDMYVFNKKIFDPIAEIPDDGYGHIYADTIGDTWYFPGYYHVASGRKFKEYLELSDTFEEDCRLIYTSNKYGAIRDPSWKAPDRIKDKKDWEYICSEEHLSTERLLKRIDLITKIRPPKGWVRFESPYSYHGHKTPVNFDYVELFKQAPKEYWGDFHSPRPYTLWSRQIEEILDHFRDSM